MSSSASFSCPHCGSDVGQVKNGHDVSGSARMKCQSCRRAYSVAPKEAGHGPAMRLQAVRYYLEGLNFRWIGRLLGVHHQSVINWVNAYHANAKEQVPGFPNVNPAPSAAQTQPHDDRTGTSSLQTVEGDEIFTFVGSKKTRLPDDAGGARNALHRGALRRQRTN